MGRACSTHETKREFHITFMYGRLNGRDMGVDGRLLLKWILKKKDGKLWT
jgi:hypothetical protein